MNENEANTANYDELASHVTDIESRLSTLSGAKDPVREDLQELRADYYERAIQMRQMRCQTLEAIVTETTDKLHAVSEHARWLTFQRRLVMACVLTIAIVMVAIDSDPQLLNKAGAALQTTEAMTHGACLLVGGIAVWWARRKPPRRGNPKRAA